MPRKGPRRRKVDDEEEDWLLVLEPRMRDVVVVELAFSVSDGVGV